MPTAVYLTCGKTFGTVQHMRAHQARVCSVPDEEYIRHQINQMHERRNTGAQELNIPNAVSNDGPVSSPQDHDDFSDTHQHAFRSVSSDG